MQIKLLNHENTPHYVEIPDDTDHVDIHILSGDMLMIHPIYYDTGRVRDVNYFDGAVIIPHNKFDALNSLTKSCEIFDITD